MHGYNYYSVIHITVTLLALVLVVNCSDTYGECGSSFYVGFSKMVRSNKPKLSVMSCTAIPVAFTVTNNNRELVYNGTAVHDKELLVDIPASFTLFSGTHAERHKGLHISSLSGYPISVLVIMLGGFSAYTAHHCSPPQRSQYTYYVMALNTTISRSVFYLVGCHNNTVITITPTTTITLPMDAQDSGSASFSLPSGSSHSITLHQFQTLIVLETNADVTGTRIESNKPLTVVGGSECGQVPVGLCCCNMVMMQSPPTAVWRKTHLISRWPGFAWGYYIQAIATVNHTNLTFTCGTNVTRGSIAIAGEFFAAIRQNPDSYCSLISTEPILVAQFSFGFDKVFYGDPSITGVASIEQYSTQPVYFTSMKSLVIDYNFVSIIVPAEHFPNSLIFLDDEVILEGWQPILDENITIGYGNWVELDEPGLVGVIGGTGPFVHSVRQFNPEATMAVTIYGVANHVAYAYMIGRRYSLLGQGM